MKNKQIILDELIEKILQYEVEDKEFDELYKQFRQQLAKEDCCTNEPSIKQKQRIQNWINKKDDDIETQILVGKKLLDYFVQSKDKL